MSKVRVMTQADYDHVAAVLGRNGLTVGSRDDWVSLWIANPFRDPAMDMGWVLEDAGGALVGTFGNLPLGYEWNGRPIRVAAAYAWAVDPAFRKDSVRLLRRYLRQARVDLLLTSTASSRVGEIFSAVRFEPVPHADYDRALLWVTRPQGFARAALRQLGMPFADLLGYPVGLALGAITRRSVARRSHLAANTARLTGFDARFDAFWKRLRQTPDRLLAVRTAAVLNWHFKRLLDLGQLVILGLEGQDALDGYLVMFRHDHAAIGLTRYRVADLQVLGDVRSGARQLLEAALALAADEGVHALEVIGLNAAKREALAPLSPRRRQLPSRLFYYRPLNPALTAPLRAVSAWDPSPFDGDASL
jgi:hypothetical protein